MHPFFKTLLFLLTLLTPVANAASSTVVNTAVEDIISAIQRTDYYPSGLPFPSMLNPQEQPYKFNGKEFDTMHGLNMYDYSARHYDAAIMRWHVPDALAEKYYSISPYAYCANNPVRFIDPTGMAMHEWNYNTETKELEWVSNKGGDERQYVNFVDGEGNVTTETSVAGSDAYVYELSDGHVVTNYDAQLSKGYNTATGYTYSVSDFIVREKLRKGGMNSPIRTYVLSSEAKGAAIPVSQKSMEDFYGDDWRFFIGAVYLGMAFDIGTPSLPASASPKGFSLSKGGMPKTIDVPALNTGNSFTEWNSFLRATKGMYRGKGWQRQAVQDFNYIRGK